jgi:hypothetical protein
MLKLSVKKPYEVLRVSFLFKIEIVDTFDEILFFFFCVPFFSLLPINSYLISENSLQINVITRENHIKLSLSINNSFVA